MPTNSAPSTSNQTRTINEDTAYTLTAADFNFSDPDSGDTLQTVTIDSLPTQGTLQLNGTNVSLGQVIGIADITAGRLVYTPAADANGAAYGSFGFKVSDGIALSASAATLTFNVTAVDDAPVLSNVTASASYAANAAGTVLAPTLTVSDVDNTTSTSASVRISAGAFAGDRLAATTTGTLITAKYDSSSFTLTLSGTDTLAHYQQVLNTVAYSSTSNDPTNSGAKLTRTLDWQLDKTSDFAAKTDFATGYSPGSVTTGDFNGDGKLDMAVANASSGSVSILLGNGSGGFAVKTDFATGVSPSSVTTGDFDGDGKLDMAVASAASSTVSVLLGNGTGGFAPRTDFATGNTPISVTTGDFNGDGKLDMAVANLGSSSVSVLLGNGSGGFDPKTDFATGFGPKSVTTGDFNGDGKLDMAVANQGSSSVSVLLGNGSGGFDPKTDFATGYSPVSVTTGDFNGDGILDMAVANQASSSVSVLLGIGRGSFAARTDFATGSTPYSVTTGDFNGDGTLDMAVANYSSRTVSVLLGNGSDDFADRTDFATGNGPLSVTTGDFNGDGKLDMTVGNYNSDSVSVLLGNGSAGSVVQQSNITVTTNNAPTTTNHLATSAEDTAYTLSASDFNFADADTTDSLKSVTIITTPAAGTLKLSGNSVAANAVVSIADINAGNLVFMPAANGNGNAYTSFQFQVNDGTAVSNTASWSVNITPVNDAPTGNVTISGTVSQGNTLTASNTLADIDGMGSVSYQWKADGVAISGATGNSLILTQAQVGKAITVAASYTDGFGANESLTSGATANVANINDAPTGSVTISGTASQGNTLTASNTLADVDGMGTVSYRWKADGIAISGATGATLVLAQAQVGKAITVAASYTDGGSVLESVASSATAAVVDVNDAPTGSVTISGTASQGNTLSASNTLADMDGMGTVSYQWKANGVTINGATGATLVLAQAQVGKAITVAASYTDGGGANESLTSGATANVANINDAPTGSVTISGTANQGNALSASNTLADIDGMGTVTYQWKADGIAISGATGATLVLAQAQVGKAITVAASYTDGGGAKESLTSSMTTKVANLNDAPTGGITISGTASQGNTLTANNTLADIDGMGTISYQWKANGTAINGATGNTLVLNQAQVGKTITLAASYTDGFGAHESLTSSATANVANVNDAPTGNVIINGTASQGNTLSINNTLADIDGMGTITYQWKADGAAINGATGNTLALSQAQVGKTITVSASYTDSFGANESMTSSATSSVANINDAPTGSVTIGGIAAPGHAVIAMNNFADIDGLGSISYQWLANGIAITNANANMLFLGEAQANKSISVIVSYTDQFGTNESLTSNTTLVAAQVEQGSTIVTVTATPEDDVLFASANRDVIDGLAGYDTVAYAGSIADFALTRIGNVINVSEKSHPLNLDTLSHIESIKFNDFTVNLGVHDLVSTLPNGAGQNLLELYMAFFNRVPDADGLSYWANRVLAGDTMGQIADSFYAAGVQFFDLTGYSATMSNADFVNVIYKNVLGRPDGADAEGLTFWTAALDSGKQTHGSLVTTILSSAHTFKGDATWGWVADLLDNKLAVSKAFAVDLGLGYNSPEESIIEGAHILSLVTPTDTSAALALIGVAALNVHLV